VVIAVSALSSERTRWATAQFTPRAGWALVFLVVCGTVLGMASYTWLLRVVSPAAVGTYAFVNPVIALLLGRAVGDDQIGPRTLVAAALVVTSVVLIQRAAARPRGAQGSPVTVSATLPARSTTAPSSGSRRAPSLERIGQT